VCVIPTYAYVYKINAILTSAQNNRSQQPQHTSEHIRYRKKKRNPTIQLPKLARRRKDQTKSSPEEATWLLKRDIDIFIILCIGK
jgi:hypothetical protein